MSADTPESRRKAQLDALLLALPGVSARTLNQLDAYFVSDKMFACISGKGVGLRLPVAMATELQFSRDNVVPFQPGGMANEIAAAAAAPTLATTNANRRRRHVRRCSAGMALRWGLCHRPSIAAGSARAVEGGTLTEVVDKCAL